ncbi:hypothetical protein ABL78_2381 [Leptomonas seymouri]|uniref:Uncharacterized protein n=1 Tax=Leptomonas seymouri TaxID=5684 RepID=A0A0N1I997_LEPSE|nr:hypothetical protein ABL78_2381 [Leptomonas seymouri]|eukprot:KPI88485.1 hypothetical protein ABL78_2381 [Leptomonas seymouri]
MEIESLKMQLGNLLALHRDDDANEDDIVFATVDYMKNAHGVAQMLLLEGRFQELQRCLHLCQAAFGNTTNVRASLVNFSGGHAPLLSFVGASAEGAYAEDGRQADPRASKPSFAGPSQASAAAAHGGSAADGDGNDAPKSPHQQQYPFFVLHSDEDQRVFAALQSRTAQLQKQLEAAMRTRRGRDTEYYMQRLGLREMGAAPVETKERNVKVHVQQLPAFPHSPHATSSSIVPMADTTQLSTLPAAPPRPHRAVRQSSVLPQPPRNSSFTHFPPVTMKTGSATAGTGMVSAIPPHQLWMNSGDSGTEAAAPVPPERGVSFGNQIHFGRGKGRIELPPLVTSGRLFVAARDNPMTAQHTVFGSAAAASQESAVPNAADNDSDFGIHAVETVFGVETEVGEVPLHLRPIPEDVELWSSSSSSSSSLSISPNSSGAFNMSRESMRAQLASSSCPLSLEPTLIDDALLAFDTSPNVEGNEDDYAYLGRVFISPRTTRVSSMLRAPKKSATVPSTTHSISSLMRRGTGLGAAANGANESAFINLSQRCRTASDVVASSPRTAPLTWQHSARAEKRSVDSYGMSTTLNSTFSGSMSRMLGSKMDSSTTTTTTTTASTTAAETTGISAFEQQVPPPPAPAQNACAPAIEAANAVKAARQTAQYVLSSFKTQNMRSEQALHLCDALTISRLPYNARQAALSARAALREDGVEAGQTVLRPDRHASRVASTLSSNAFTPHDVPAQIPHVHVEDWMPAAQVLTALPLPQAQLLLPTLPAAYPGSASTLQSTVASTGGGGDTTQQQSQMLPAPLHRFSPAAEQQLRDVRADYEQKLVSASSAAREMEARWVSQHNQLQSHLSRPPLENIAEWCKRRGRRQQQHNRSEHSSKDGNSNRRLKGHSRHRLRVPPPVPPLATRMPAGLPPTSIPPLSRSDVRGSDISLVVPPDFAQSPLPSPLRMSTTPTQVSRLSSFNPEEGCGPLSRISSAVAPQPSLESVRLETNTTTTTAQSLFLTPAERQSLRLADFLCGNAPPAGAVQHLSHYSRRDSPQTLSLLPAAPPRAQPTIDTLQESAPLVDASVRSGDAMDDGVAPAAWTPETPEKRGPEVHGAWRNVNSDNGAEKAQCREGEFDCGSSTGPDASSSLAVTPSSSVEVKVALVEPSAYTYRGEEWAMDTADNVNAQQTEADGTAARHEAPDVPYTYHPAVNAIIAERRQRVEKQSMDRTLMPYPCTAEDTIAAWQRTLRAVVGDVKENKAITPNEQARLSRTAGQSSSLDTLAYTGKTLSGTHPSLRTVLKQQSAGQEPTPLRRHGIRCGAAAVRMRRTQEILSAAIRDASGHVREEDLVLPAWKQTEQSPSADLPQAPLTTPTPRPQGRSPFLFDLLNAFATGAATLPPVVDAGATGSAAATVTAKSNNNVSNNGSAVDEHTVASSYLKDYRSAITAAADRTPDMSFIFDASAATTTLTPVVLSLTANALTPRSPLQSTKSSSHHGTPHMASQYLHAIHRVSELLRAAPDWTIIAPSVLGRCLPLCTTSVRLQRWWRQRLACRELQARQNRVHAYILHQQQRDTAALRVQRQLRVHWARQVVAQLQAACAAATEQRVAAEKRTAGDNPMASASSSANANINGYVPFGPLNGAPGGFAGSTSSSLHSHRAVNRVISVFAGSEDRSHASFGDVQVAAATAAAAAAGMRQISSQPSVPSTNVSLPTSLERATPTSNRLHRAAAVAATPSSDTSMSEDDAQHSPSSIKGPLAATARRSPSHNNDQQPIRPHPAPTPSSSSSCAQTRQKVTSMTVEVPHAISAAEGMPSRPLAFLFTGRGDSASNRRSTCTAAPAGEKPDKKQSQSTAIIDITLATLSTSRKQQDSVSAALRIQRWYRHCSAKKMVQLRREAEVLAAVVTGRAPLTAVRDALRGTAVHWSKEGEAQVGGECSKGSAEDEPKQPSMRRLEDSGDWDMALSITEMRELLTKCTGDVYHAYLRRAAVARQQGDYKTALERVSLRALRRVRQEREDEAKQRKLTQERQQRLRQEQKQRRERLMMDSAKLLQRVGRGLRWRRWLRERQCKDLHYHATHTLDFLSQTDISGSHAMVDARRETKAAVSSQSALFATSAEEQRVHLAGGPKLTAHIAARLRAKHPEWFGLNVDKESATWIVRSATPAQLAAIEIVNSFLAAFASRMVTFEQYYHACARSIQLAWRLHQRRRRFRKSQRKPNAC